MSPIENILRTAFFFIFELHPFQFDRNGCEKSSQVINIDTSVIFMYIFPWPISSNDGIKFSNLRAFRCLLLFQYHSNTCRIFCQYLHNKNRLLNIRKIHIPRNVVTLSHPRGDHAQLSVYTHRVRTKYTYRLYVIVVFSFSLSLYLFFPLFIYEMVFLSLSLADKSSFSRVMQTIEFYSQLPANDITRLFEYKRLLPYCRK